MAGEADAAAFLATTAATFLAVEAAATAFFTGDAFLAATAALMAAAFLTGTQVAFLVVFLAVGFACCF